MTARPPLLARCLIFTVLLALGLAFGLPARAAQPDQRLLTGAQQAQPALIDSLREMVLIESGSGDAAGLAKMAAYAEARLKALGARTELRAAGTGPGSIVIGKLTGSGSKRIMLLAHMDTVYREGVLQTQPYRVEDKRIYGPGIADDKGGIALILHALQILKEAGWRDYAAITVLFNPDEEIGSPGSGELIAALGAEHDYVLSAEPSPAVPELLLLGTSGVGRVTMQVRGRAAHAGAAPQSGRNALIELAHQLLQTRDINKTVPGVQLNWTTAQAGVVHNQIPEEATAVGDLRLMTPDGYDRVEAALKERVRQRLVPDTEITISVERGRPPFAGGEASRALAKKGQAIYAELDRRLALVESTGGGTDAGFAARSGKAVVLESLGLAGGGYHARSEYIAIDSIVPRLYLLTRLLQEIGKE